MGVVGKTWHLTARQLSHIFLFSSVALSMELGVLARVPGFFAHCAQDGASSTFLFGMARYRAVETGYLSQTSLFVHVVHSDMLQPFSSASCSCVISSMLRKQETGVSSMSWPVEPASLSCGILLYTS